MRVLNGLNCVQRKLNNQRICSWGRSARKINHMKIKVFTVLYSKPTDHLIFCLPWNIRVLYQVIICQRVAFTG